MRKRLGAAAATAAASLPLLTAPGAAAAVSSEAGWGCTANGSKPGSTLLATPTPGSPYSPLVKESPGVIVSWGVRVGPGLSPLAQQLGVFRPTGSADEYTKVAESASETFAEGFDIYPARIPVQAGDVLGLHGPAETFFCAEGGPAALLEGNVGLGETKIFKTEGGFRSSVNAVVEADVDGDGYGDSRQDGCPESALFQTDCPLVALEVGDVTVKHRAILIEVGNNTEASVKARGEVGWSVRPKVTGGAPGSSLRKVRIKLNAPAKTVMPGTTAVLRVPLPKPVLRQLDRRSPQQALRARIDVVGTNLIPYVGTHELKIRLPGRKRPGAAGTLRE